MHIIPSWVAWIIASAPFIVALAGVWDYVSGRWIDGW